MGETNVFRTMMLMGGIITLAIFMTTFFAAPVIEANQSVKVSYELVMGCDFGADTKYPDHLTMYEAMMYSIEGKTRGSVRHY